MCLLWPNQNQDGDDNSLAKKYAHLLDTSPRDPEHGISSFAARPKPIEITRKEQKQLSENTPILGHRYSRAGSIFIIDSKDEETP